VPHLSPTTLTAEQQRLILRATAANFRDHLMVSLALGTGLRLAEIVGLDVGDVYAPEHPPGSGACPPPGPPPNEICRTHLPTSAS
jgi:hypothetical protein